MKRILMVDDNAVIPTFLNLRYRNTYHIDWVEDVESAIAYLDIHPLPDLIITDLQMPQTSGFQLIDVLQANPLWSTIPIVVLSGKADSNHRLQALEKGVSIFVGKPFHPKELDIILEREINAVKS